MKCDELFRSNPIPFIPQKGEHYKVQKEIETKLPSGEYIISLASKEVHALEGFQLIAYFDFEVYDDTEYQFEID